MVAFLRRQRLNPPLASLVGGTIGLLVAIMFVLLPTGVLEDLVIDSGVAAVVSAAEPPLGYTARFALALLFGGAVGSAVWFTLFLSIGNRAIWADAASDASGERTPILRRADAHPDAPARRPLSALRDLGDPFFDPDATIRISLSTDESEREPAIALAVDVASPEPPVERGVPADLDQPLASFDPQAIPDEPANWSPAPPPLASVPRRQIYEPAERFDTFELAPIVRKIPTPLPVASERMSSNMIDPSASIHALLDRLEQGVGRREMTAAARSAPLPVPHAESLEDALVTLRRLAARG